MAGWQVSNRGENVRGEELAALTHRLDVEFHRNLRQAGDTSTPAPASSPRQPAPTQADGIFERGRQGNVEGSSAPSWRWGQEPQG